MQTLKEKTKRMVDALDEKQTILTIAYMCSFLDRNAADAEVAISALDKLCGNGAKLWTQDPEEYIRGLRDNDRV